LTICTYFPPEITRYGQGVDPFIFDAYSPCTLFLRFTAAQSFFDILGVMSRCCSPAENIASRSYLMRAFFLARLMGCLLFIFSVLAFPALAQGNQPSDECVTAVPRWTLQRRIGSGAITDMALSPDGTVLAVASSRGIYLYDALTLDLITSLLLPDEKSASTVAWIADGKAVLAGYADGVRAWNIESGAVNWWYPKITDVTHLDWSEAAYRAVVLNTGFSEEAMRVNIYTDLRVMDAYSDRVLIRRTDLSQNINQAFWSPDGNRLAYLEGKPLPLVYPDTDAEPQDMPQAQVVIWLADGSQPDIRLFPADELLDVQSVAWSPDGTRIALDIGLDETSEIQIRDANDGRLLYTLPAGAAPMWSADGSRFLIYQDFYEEGVIIYNAEFEEAQFLPIGNTQQVLLSSDGSRIYANQWGTLVIYDTNGQPLASLDQHPFRTLEAVWSPDGNYLATRSDNSPSNVATVFIWDDVGNLRQHIFTDGVINSMYWSPDGSRLALAKSNALEIHTLASAESIVIAVDHPHQVAWSPDGTQLAAILDTGDVDIWQVTTGGNLEHVSSPVANLDGTANSSDSRIVWTQAAGLRWLIRDWDGVSRIYTSGQVEPIADLGALDYVISGSNPEFLPDGRLRYTLYSDTNTISIYDVDSKQVVESRQLRREITGLSLSQGLNCHATFGTSEQILNTAYGSLYIYDQTGQLIRDQLLIPTAIDDIYASGFIAWSLDGTRSAVVLDDGTVMLWGVPSE
jgi:WD40 repeat protein